MNKLLYNQLSSKLYEAYAKIRMQDEENHDEDSDDTIKYFLSASFVKDLEIDERIVDLFDTIYEAQAMGEGFDTGGIFSSIKSLFPMPKKLQYLDHISLAEKGRIFAIQAHRDVDQLYGDKIRKVPYEYHLWKVAQFCKKYIHHIPEADRDIVEAAAWNHDVVEDGHKTFNDIAKALHEKVAALACALSTNVHGHNRAERADADYYRRIRSVEYGIFVKLCDRLANVSEGGDMVKTYRKEMPKFLESLGPDVLKYQDMINELNKFVGL